MDVLQQAEWAQQVALAQPLAQLQQLDLSGRRCHRSCGPTGG